jgi:hypothetical protein
MALHMLLQMRRLPELRATLLATMAGHSVRHTTTTFRVVIQIIQFILQRTVVVLQATDNS